MLEHEKVVKRERIIVPICQSFGKLKKTAAVSCSPGVYRLGGVGLGSWLPDMLGRAWVVYGCVVFGGVLDVMWWCVVGVG